MKIKRKKGSVKGTYMEQEVQPAHPGKREKVLLPALYNSMAHWTFSATVHGAFPLLLWSMLTMHITRKKSQNEKSAVVNVPRPVSRGDQEDSGLI